MEALCGKWQLISVDNVKEYCDAIGTSPENTERAKKYLMPENNITQDIQFQENSVHIITAVPSTSIDIKVSLGQEIDTKFMDGRDIKCIFTFADGKLKEEQTGAFTSTNYRYRDGHNLVMTMTSSGVTSKRVYKKI